jgi:hypothetical protein
MPISRKTGDDLNIHRYARNFYLLLAVCWRILDTAGLCLTPTDQNAVPKDAHTDGTSKIKVAACSSNDLQKWNAPANTNIPTPLTNLNELPSS